MSHSTDVGCISNKKDRNMNIYIRAAWAILRGRTLLQDQLERDHVLIKQWMKDNPNASDEEFKKWWDAEVEKGFT